VKKFLIIIGVILLVVEILAGVGWWLVARAGGKEAEVKTVRVEGPVRGDLVEIVSARGEVTPQRHVSISARVAARVVELPFEEGDRVTAGGDGVEPSVLIRLDASDMEAALRSAKARRAAQAAEIAVFQANIASQKSSVAALAASLGEAERELVRKKKLHASGDISESAFDQATSHVEELTAQFEAAEHTLHSLELRLTVRTHQLTAADWEIAQATDRLSYMTIVSPIDGTVLAINAEVGELVVTGTMNNPGTVIMEVADLGRMLVVAEVDESDIGGIAVGQRATIETRAYPDRTFSGTVDSVALKGLGMRFEPKVFTVEILLDAQDSPIRSGLTAEVEIETRRHADVLKVPSQAVLGRRVDELPAEISEDNPNVDHEKTFATVVYRCVDGKAVATPVTVGASDNTHTIIRAGLTTDDRIITGPYKVLEQLKHDQKLKVEEVSPPTTTRPASAPAGEGDEA